MSLLFEPFESFYMHSLCPATLKYFLNLFTTGFFVTAACLEMILLMSEMDPVNKGTNSHKDERKNGSSVCLGFFFCFFVSTLNILHSV